MNPKITPIFLVFIAVAIFVSSLSFSMAEEIKTTQQHEQKEEEPAKLAVDEEELGSYIVYALPPEGEEQETYNIRTLATVVGSEEGAKKVVGYHYKHAASGFSAMLTPKQVEELSKQPGVLQIVPDTTYELLGPKISTGINLSLV